MSSINGKIISDNWGNESDINKYSKIYENCHNSFESQAWMVGRVTMQRHFSSGQKPALIKPEKPIDRKPHSENKNASSFAIAVDPKGKLFWESNEISGDHIIALLTEQVSDEYLNYLQQQKVSYVFAGKMEMDFHLALQQLNELFNIQTLMLEGGGHINGSLLNDGLIDEVSLLIVPVADNTPDTPTTFELGEYKHKSLSEHFHLKEVKRLEHDVLWLNYSKGTNS